MCHQVPNFEAVRWLHLQHSPDSVEWLQEQLQQDQRDGREPLIDSVWAFERIVAAAYIRVLPAGIARIGDFYAEPSHTQQLVAILGQQMERLPARQISMVEATVRSHDTGRISVLSQIGFQFATEVQQLVRPVDETETLSGIPQNMGWISAAAVPTASFARLVRESMMQNREFESLDSNLPASNEDLLTYLDDGSPESVDRDRQALNRGIEAIGCLLLRHLAGFVTEVAYLGLKPAYRQQGHGRELVTQAIRLARDHGSHVLVVYVDRSNIPACRLYRSHGFEESQVFSVFRWPTC